MQIIKKITYTIIEQEIHDSTLIEVTYKIDTPYSRAGLSTSTVEIPMHPDYARGYVDAIFDDMKIKFLEYLKKKQ